MAAQVDIAVDQKDLPGTTTLPAIQEGRPNLVSPPQEGKTPSLKEAASQWAYGIRTRLSECIGQGKEVSREDVCELEREIITGFITALQQDSHSEWMLLCEKLAFLEPFKGCFTCFVAKDELFHYLERILHHMELHKERLFDVQVTQTLSKIFPKEVCEVKEKGGKPARTYCGPSPPLVKPPCSPRKFPRVTLPDGSDPFDLRVPDNDETYLVVKPLSFGDLRKSFGAVALEVASREAVWGHCLGTTFQALSTNIPEEPPVVPEEARKSTPNPSSGEGTAPSPRASPHSKTQASPRKPMTGREAVLYLAGCHHIGKIETLFLNIAPHRHFRPYDLIEVHQNDINKEHYVFSTFSILHVYGDQPSERLSLAEWQREAVLWNAVSHIPFFKNYLRSKMFHRWRTNKLRLDFLRKQKLLEEQLLQAVPRYAAALLQISRLLKELLTVNFLPLEAEASYTIATFKNLMNYRNVQADKTLEKFFNYCKVTADVTAEESFKLLAYCEDQVQKKSVFSKDSLHLQRLKKEQREANLLKARRETGRLGNLVKLMDQLVMEHLFEITKTQVCRFVDQVMRSRHDAPDRDGTGLFQVNLVFTKHDVLGLSPEREKILSAVLGTLKDIPVVLCARATPGEPQGVYEPQRDAASAASSTHKSTKGLVKALDLRRKQSSAMSPSTPINATMDSDRSQKTLTTMISDHGSEARGSAASHASRETKSPHPGSLLDGTGEDFPAPELPKWAEPTKEEDDLGVATPDLVLKRDPCLYVDGEGFMGQYHPLSTANLQEKLAIDKEFQAYLESAQEMVEAAMLEVDQYCEANAWLNQIHLFTSRWTERSVRNFAGVAAFTIEQKLNEIRQWSERIRIFDQSFLTENGLIYVDCCHIHDDLRPQLDKIYLQLVTFVADEVKRLSREFCKEMSFVVYTLKEKRKTVEAFASYAKNFNLFKKNTPQYQQQLDYIKSLFEVIRMSYRQLSSDEEKLEESVLQSWEAFLYQIQAASEFVNTQTPLFSQQLENTYTRLKHAKTPKQQNEAAQPPSQVMVLEKEAYELADKGTSGIFLDPNQDPTQVLTELKKIRMRFFSVREQLTEASWRREAISGDPYDLTYLTRLTQRLDVRYELWKYVEVSALAVADWKNLLFKKLNTRKALEKLVEWQTAAGHLKVHLPQGDEVLALWYRTLQDFKTKLPLLHKLRHESLKERHWKAIFVGIGDVYDPRRELLVSELLSFNLDYNDRLIEQICGNALGEYDLKVQIQRTAKFWRERDFKLAKHIPDSVYNNKDLQHKIRQSRSGRSNLEKFRMEKQVAMVEGQRCLDVTSSDFYILTAADQLHYELEDSLISIHAMLSSPHLACMEQEVRFWSKALNQIQEITELWLSAQEKWLYLLKLFEQPEIYRRFSQVSFKFESINKKFQDFMKVVLLDPKCLSVTNHRRGDRGYRLLQGDNLSALLVGLITAQEEILRHLESLSEEVRQDFPRLHFLSDSELVAMLGVSRNPEALVPTVNKCFLGIENVKFSLPPELDSLNTSLDYTLHADKLCGVSIQGRLGETVNLCESLEPQSHPTKWLTTLERLMRSSLAQLLQAAVQARMEAAPVARAALEELGASSDCETEPGQEPVFQHWLLKFPAQCVLVSEAVLWEKTMTRILDHQNPGDLGSLISHLQRKVEEYTEILREDIRGKVDPLLKTRLRRLLSNLVGQAIYIRDVTTDIKKSGRVSLGSFDWLKVLKYHIDIKSVLRAKTEVSTASPEETRSPTPRGSPQATARVSPTRRCHTPMDKVPEESPRLPRTKTTVSSAYSFSQCVVHMLGSPFSYDYEYHGPSSRLVLTPLTERAFISLTSTLQSFHCGTLVGPPATGKSQTIQELSKAMGRHLVTVSCNEEITLPLLTQYLSGMIQSGSWVLFDNAGRLTQGLMSVLAQQVDYVRSALKALSDSASSQYNLRGQPRYDKYGRRVFYDIEPQCGVQKPGTGEKVIRRNSLTTLHPLPPDPQPGLPRQNTVPHGFNEKGLSTYFEDRWVEEREGRRHSIEREIRIQESELYKSNKPPPLFYEHVMSQRRKSSPDYSKLSHDDSYQPHFMGNLMFNGRLMLANASYGCFMTFNSNSPTYSTKLPHQLRLLIRPCALVVPDSRRIIEVLLYAHGFEDAAVWTNKLSRLLFLVDLQLPSKPAYCSIGLREMKTVIALAGKKRLDHGLDREIHTAVLGYTTDEVVTTQTVHSREEFCLVTAVNRVLLPRMETLDDRIRLRTILHELFPSTIRMENKSEMDNPKLKETLSELLRQNHQFSSEDFLNKILQLQSAVEVKRGAVLVGPSGSGKTTCYRTLAEAWNHLNYQLFAPDHTKEQIDIHKMILSTTPIPQGQLKLQSLEAEDREARHRWRRAEKDLVSMLNTKTDIQSLGSEVTPTHALYPKVHLLNITPNALTPEQLFGSFDEGLWTDGILTQTLRGMETQSRAMNTVLTQSKVKRSGSSGAKATQDLPSYLLQWLILDGTVNPSWSENLNTMLDEHRRLSSADRENIGFQDSAMVLFETSDLSWASPAMVARTTVIHFDSDLVQWKWLYDSWAETCKTEFMMTSSSLTVLNDLVTDVFGPTLKFLANECTPSLLSDISQQSRRTNQTARGIQEVSSFLKILSSLLSKCFLRDDLEKRLKKMDTDAQLSLFTTEEESGRPSTLSRSLSSRLTTTSVLEEIIPNHLDLIKSMFVFSYVWAFGGCLHDRHKEKFDKFVREMLLRTNHPLRLPSPGLVYDYQVDMASGGLVRWSEHSVDRPRGLSAAYVITPEVACYQYLLELLLGSGHSVLLTGPTAVGKSSLVQNVVALKQKLTRVQMSAGMTSEFLRSRLLSHLQDNAQGQPVVSSGSSLTLDDKRLTFFIDDLNTAHGDQFCQPPLELLREVLGEAGVYDLARKSVTDTREATFLALATSPSEPGSGLGRSCHVMSSRLTRLLVTLTYFQPCSQSVLSVVRKPILSWLEEFPTYSVEHHQDFADAMSLGLLELYQAVKEKFRPTPAHAHYLFSFHDISRAIQGILLMSPRSRTRKIQARRRDRDNARSRVGIEALQDMLRQTSNVSSVSAASGEGSAPMMRLIAQLWCHECTRVFSDRLINPQDLVWYQKTLESVAIKHFCSPRDHWQTNMTAIDEEPSGSRINGRFTPVNSRPLTPSEESNKGKSPMTTGGHESVEMPDFATPRVQSSRASQGHTPGSNGSQGSDVPRSAPMSGASGESTQGKTTFTDNVTTARSQSTSGTDPGPNDTLATLDTEALPQTDVSSEEADSSSEDDLSSSDETDSGDSELDKSHYEEGGQTGLQTELNPIAAALASRRISKQSKRGVTFKTGLVMGNEQDSFDGPLMTVEELKGGHKNLTDVMFSKYYMKALTESKGLLVEKGYVESSESKLTEALYLCLKMYNAATSQQLDVAFFSDAVRHAARLGRVMAMPGGHALLLGVSYSTGRSTLTKLAACIAQRKVYEPKSQATPVQTRSVLREHIRRCCLMAGVGKRPAVLLVHEALGEACLRDVSCLMAEGTCPGLYTEDQLQDVVAQMMPGGVQTKRVDKIDQAFERFLKNVRQNLHVIVCLNYAGNSFSSSYSGLRDKLEMCPALIKHAVSIDVYRQWDNNAYVSMASRWLRHNSSKINVPWSQTMKEEQITQASAAMGYVHLSARAACEQLYCHHTQPLRFYTPRTFMEFTRMFKVIAAHLAKREQGVMERYERLLGKMSEALATISAYKKEVSELIPQFSQAKDHIQHCMDQVEEGKTQYKEELELCRVQEEKIAELQRPMEHLRTRLSSAYDKARPSYEAAKRALSALDDKATAELGELKSYRQPPATVTWVVGALCVLFDRKEDWDSGKQLLLKENLVNDLIFYDKENIPPGIFNKLERYVKNPDFTPSEVRQASAALSCMCAYIHAVYNYALIHKGTYPLRQNLMDAMSKFDKAQAKLGQMRLAAGRKKGLLEKSIENYKDAVKDCKALEKRIMSFEKRIRKCTQVVTNMKPHHTQWKTEVKKAKAHIETAPGDALITAACVCYFGPLDDKTRAELLQDWMKFCRAGNLGTIAASDASVSLSARLDNLMDQNQSVFSEGGFNPKDPTKMTAESECAVNESNSYIVLDSVTVKDHSDGRVSPSVLQGDNPSGRRVYRYRPSIQESSIGKLDLRSDPEDVGSTLFSVETEGSDTDEEKSPLMLRQDFSLPDTLSSETELQNWKLQGLPTDSHALQNALIMRVCCDNRRSVWPLLVDPDGQAETWVRALQQSNVSMREAEVSRPDSSTGCEGADISDCVPPSNGRHTRMSHFTADTTFTMADDSYSAAETSMSQPTKDDENLRPVTAVTQSWDTNGDSVIVEEEIGEPPRDRLWVVEADHPQLHYYLINSIVHGFTILVTHLERKPLDPVFCGVLFKQLHVDGDGNRVVRVGGTDYRYHTDFRLYLTTDLPLFTKGDRVCHLPVEKMCVIGLGLSDVAMVTRILDETMEVERAEFHTQVRSNNKDLVHNTKMLRLANDVVCDKVLGMETPLLKDKTLLASLQACEQDTERHRAILEETNFVRDSLEQRRQPYVSMATQVTMLYAMARKMSVLDPLYYLPFFRFIQLFRKVLEARNRGKGVAGDILARSQELSDATTGMLHKYVTLMMPEKHAILFSLLVAMERMRLKGQLTNQEMALFINGFEVPEDLQEASQLEEKPDWLSEDTLARCMTLESVHDPFQGLVSSLLNHSSEWDEYFHRPLVLMNSAPGTEFGEMSVFQKCLLWKIICPYKVCMIAEALTVYELGAIISPPKQHDIKELYSHTNCGIPTVFIQPQGTSDDGFSTFEPVHELKRLAREEGMDGRLRILSYGVRSQMAEVRQALEDCATNGYWLLLENYHLAEPLDQETFTLLKTIVNSQPEDKTSLYEEELNDWESLTQSAAADSEPVSVGPAVTVCPSFRLFVTTAGDQGQLLPGILIQHGLKVHCGATRNFRSRLHKAYRNTAFLLKHWTHPFHRRASAQSEEEDKSEYVLPLALLHAVLLHRRNYGSLGAVNNNNWSLVDLVAATDMFRALSAQCNDLQVVAEGTAQVYGGQCTDPHDEEVIKAIGTAILNSNESPNTGVPLAGCGRLLDRLSRDGGQPFSLKAALDSLHDITATSVSLSDTADDKLTAAFSRVISRDMVRTVGAPELFVSLDSYAHDTKLQACLRELDDCVEDCPELPETSRDELSPLDVFYHYEVERYKSVLETLKEDLGLLQRQHQGEISISPETKLVLDSLSEDKIPRSWLGDSVPPCSSALEWLKALPEKLRKLSHYISGKSKKFMFELSVFLHPSEFLHATLMDYARQQFKNAEQLQYEAKVLPFGSPPTSPPETGLYLCGLILHNAAWDRSREQLTLTTPTSGHAHHLPIIWLSPTQLPGSRTSSASSDQSDSQVYFCPVFSGSPLEDSGHGRLVTRIAMATGRAHPSVWTERRVFISTECYV